MRAAVISCETSSAVFYFKLKIINPEQCVDCSGFIAYFIENLFQVLFLISSSHLNTYP